MADSAGYPLRRIESLLDDGLSSLREGLEPARDVRLPHRGEFAVALGNATRIGIALLAGTTFLVLAGWPASVSALSITTILCALSTTMPNPSKFAVAAMVSFVLASVSAGIVRFYVLTELQDFVRLAIAIAPVLIFGCLLSVRPAIAGIGLITNNIFLVLLAPSNPQVYNPLTFYSECMFVAFALGVVFLASRLVWPVSALDKQHAAVRATQKALAAAVAGAEYSLPALKFVWLPGSPTTSRRLPAHGVRVGKYLRACFRSMTCRLLRRRLIFIWSRVRTARPSVQGLTNCNGLFGPGTADDFALAPDRSSDGCSLVKPRYAERFWPRRQIFGRQAWCLSTRSEGSGTSATMARSGKEMFDGRCTEDEKAVCAQGAPLCRYRRPCRRGACCRAPWLADLCDISMDARRHGPRAGRKRGTTDLGPDR